VRNPNVVDLVTRDPTTGEFAVIMYEDRAWSESDEHLDQLLAKINTYVYFIEEGGLVRSFPEAAGQPIRIQLDCNEAPHGKVRHLLADAQQLLQQRNLKLVINHIVGEPSSQGAAAGPRNDRSC
jgi:hypothetical protein